MGELARRLLGIDPRETGATRRGFSAGVPETRRRLEKIGETFLAGYHSALSHGGGVELFSALQDREPDERGFAYEGAAMALGLLDALTPWSSSRWRRFHDEHARHQTYLMHVGLGWAVARTKRVLSAPSQHLDPMNRWLVLDGRGFHDRFFARREARTARGLSGAELRTTGHAYDAGIGRGLWFVHGGDVRGLRGGVESFEAQRRDELWSGIGLAAAYAGGVGESTLRELTRAAGDRRSCLAQGAAFAAKARVLAEEPGVSAALACRVFANCTLEEASHATDLARDEALADLPSAGAANAYADWRSRTRRRLAPRGVEPSLMVAL